MMLGYLLARWCMQIILLKKHGGLANLARLRNTLPPIWTLRVLGHLGPVKRLLGRTIGLGLRREYILSGLIG